MWKTLSLTTPVTKESKHHHVKEAQSLLNGKNRHKRDFYKGRVDGRFGALSATATRRAKYELGYPKKQINGSFGKRLRSYLVPKDHSDFEALPKSYRVRAKVRARRAKQKALGSKAVGIGKKFVGVSENPPYSNNVIFSRWYGVNGPWCAMFTSYCLVKAGSKAFKRGEYAAYVPYIANDARAGKHGMYVVARPKHGDLVCYHFGSGIEKHIGFFVEWNVDGSFTALEGNTGVGNDADGGEVQIRKDRTKRQVSCFVRVTK